VVPVLWVTALLAIACGLATTSSAVGSSKLNLAGTWSGKYSGAFSGTFKLHWTQTGSRLKGTIVLSNPTGPYTITGSVHGSSIHFGAVGVGATYTGKATSTAMSGRYNSPQGGGPWSAHKCTSRQLRC